MLELKVQIKPYSFVKYPRSIRTLLQGTVGLTVCQGTPTFRTFSVSFIDPRLGDPWDGLAELN